MYNKLIYVNNSNVYMKNIYDNLLVRGDNVQMGKNIALMAIGAGAVLAYQRYNKPLAKRMDRMVDKTLDKASKTLEDMTKS